MPSLACECVRGHPLHPCADEIGPGQVRIQIKAVGICGSDVHFWKHVRDMEEACVVVRKLLLAGRAAMLRAVVQPRRCPSHAKVHPLNLDSQGRIAHFVVEAPMVIGHESAGQVVGVGPGVTALHVGDRVALEPGIPCWEHRLSRQAGFLQCMVQAHWGLIRQPATLS